MSKEMIVEILRSPSDEDWARCRQLALVTVGKKANNPPTLEWRRKMLRCEHSPLYTLMFTIGVYDVKYWIAMQYARHHVGANAYIKTQMNERQMEYDRNSRRQDTSVDMMLDWNAVALINISRRRLCNLAGSESQELMQEICDKIVIENEEFEGFLVPNCSYRGDRCYEIQSCGKMSEVFKSK